MNINKLTFISLTLILFSCDTGDKTRTYRLPKAENKPQIKNNVNQASGFNWEKPESWIPSSGSSMRLASFSVPYTDGKGDLSVIKLGGEGGGLQSNVNRWRRQLNLEPLNINEIEKLIDRIEGKMGFYSLLQIVNENTADAVLCAILPLDNSTIFIKLSIDSNKITEVKDDFIYFCSSLNISN